MTPTTYDVTSTFVQTVDAGGEEAYETLVRIDPMRSLANRLSALGIGDRAIWAESSQALGLVGTDGGRELVFSLIWRFDGEGGHATLAWRIRIEEDAAGRTVLTTRFGGRGSDAESRGRVLASWVLVEELARGHARRLARTIEDYAEEERTTEVPRLRVVV